MPKKTYRNLPQKFSNRELLSRSELRERFFGDPSMDEDDIAECFDFFEFDFEFPVGYLRPEDDLSLLTEPPSSPESFAFDFRWQLLSLGDDLLEELNIRLKRHGTKDDWKTIRTFGELVGAWCGLEPQDVKSR
ncbi:MAG: hypothetical protein IPK58_01590 [Acidobacteria bacterium]|nr:hypothetical protein [Acidobacteriota bacterium]